MIMNYQFLKHPLTQFRALIRLAAFRECYYRKPDARTTNRIKLFNLNEEGSKANQMKIYSTFSFHFTYHIIKNDYLLLKKHIEKAIKKFPSTIYTCEAFPWKTVSQGKMIILLRIIKNQFRASFISCCCGGWFFWFYGV